MSLMIKRRNPNGFLLEILPGMISGIFSIPSTDRPLSFCGVDRMSDLTEEGGDKGGGRMR